MAHVLLQGRKVALVNIQDGVSSSYWRRDKMEATKGSLMLITTTQELLDEVIILVESMHSYEVPEVIALPVMGGGEGYLAWASLEVSEKED